jgi:hypothetical protein
MALKLSKNSIKYESLVTHYLNIHTQFKRIHILSILYADKLKRKNLFSIKKELLYSTKQENKKNKINKNLWNNNVCKDNENKVNEHKDDENKKLYLKYSQTTITTCGIIGMIAGATVCGIIVATLDMFIICLSMNMSSHYRDPIGILLVALGAFGGYHIGKRILPFIYIRIIKPGLNYVKQKHRILILLASVPIIYGAYNIFYLM